MALEVMVIGGGGREHAICWALAADPGVSGIVAVPGNPGIADLPKTRCIPAGTSDFATLADIASAEKIDVAIVGPEQPLAEGIADYFAAKGLRLFGPSKEAARLESSKSFAKELMLSVGVPTPRASVFEGPESFDDIAAQIEKTDPPWVVKADGLAQGKGVLVTSDKDEALLWARACLEGEKFGPAGARILLEDYAGGKEASVLVFCDGKNLMPLPPARDHKRLLDGDEGPNTGGMGAYSPVPEIDDAMMDSILEKIFEPIVDTMRKEGTPYVGVLYGGLVLTEEGPKVLEFNVRFGDPEAQAVLVRLAPGLSSIVDAALSKELDRASVDITAPAAVTVVLASSGYPGKVTTSKVIDGLDRAAGIGGVTVFHAGTAVQEGRIVTAGGRVLSVSAVGENLSSAREAAYKAVSEISFEGMQFRKDIALLDS